MADLRKLKDKAAQLVAKGRLEKAIEAFREVAAADPKDVATRQKLADALRKAGHDREAVETYREVADRYARDGLLIKAIAVCKVVLEIDPAHRETEQMLADLYARRQSGGLPVPPAGPPPVRAGKRIEPAAIPLDEDEGVVEIPLPRPAPPRPAPAIVPPPPPAARADALDLPPELVPAGIEEGETAFDVILAAADEAREAGVEVDVLVEVEPEEEVVHLDAHRSPVPPAGDEPLAPAAAPGREAVPIDEILEAAPAEPPRAEPGGLPPPPGPGPALPRIPLFSDLTPAAFVELTREMTLLRVAAGEPVIEEGDAGDSFYVIASGHFRVLRRDEAGQPVRLAQLSEGAFFGEMALLSGAPRTASVVAEEEGEVLEIRAGVLTEMCRHHPHVADSLTRFYRQRLLANAMLTSPLFRPFDKGERRRIMERFRTREVKAGERLVEEGRPSDGLYVVLSGSLDVLKRTEKGEVPVGRLAAGDVFGEMSCLSKGPASATVAARRSGIALRLPRSDFDEIVLTYPQILELVSELSDERAQNLDAILHGKAEFTEDGLVLM